VRGAPSNGRPYRERKGYEYKEFFATDRQPCADILILEKNPRNWLVVSTHQALALLTSSMLKTADVLRLKQHFRQRFRGR